MSAYSYVVLNICECSKAHLYDEKVLPHMAQCGTILDKDSETTGRSMAEASEDLLWKQFRSPQEGWGGEAC